MGAPIYRNAAGMGGAMGQVNADIKKKKQKTSSKTIEELKKEKDKKAAATKAEKERLNTKTKDTEARTVKQGRLSRKEAVKTAKNKAKGKRDDKINALGKYQKNLPEGISRKKEARATKRQEMQDIRNQERGARREDRANRRVKRIGDRNNMTVGEATKVYNERQEALGSFQKGERSPDPTNVDKQKVVDNNNEATELANVKAKNEDNNSWTKVDGPESTQNKQEIVSGIGGPNMLDGPSQQAASEDSSGMGTYMLDSKNRRGR